MDKKVRENLERMSNGMSRRSFLGSAAKGVFATLAALALGQFELKEWVSPRNVRKCPLRPNVGISHLGPIKPKL